MSTKPPVPEGANVQFIQLLFQYLELQRKLEPLVGPASQKLVKDLIETGTPIRKLSKITGRSPGFVIGVASGKRQLSARALSDLLRYAARSGSNAE